MVGMSTAVNVGQEGDGSQVVQVSKYLQSSGDAGNGKPVPFLNARSTSGRTSP